MGRLQTLKPKPDEYIDEIQFFKTSPQRLQRSTGVEFPVRDDRTLYHARYRTAHAVFYPDTDANELRVPEITRREKGDFSALMDKIVEEIGCSRIRFTNVFLTGTPASTLMMEMAPDDAKPLDQVLDGFEHETENWECWDDQKADTLVGEWNVD